MRYALLFICCCLTFCTLAQEDTVYVGTATLDKNEGMLTYKLAFSNINGVLSGYSVMDINGEYETKASITGTINKYKTQILFKEKSILSTKTVQTNQDFCWLQGSLKVKKLGGFKILKGHFEGYLNGGDSLCASGKLVLVSPKDIMKYMAKSKSEKEEDTDTLETDQENTDKKFEKKSEEHNVSKAKKKEQLPTPLFKDTFATPFISTEFKENKTLPITKTFNLTEPNNVEKILPGKTTSINCNTVEGTLEIWDDKIVDGDMVTIMLDDKILIKNYTLESRHLVLKINMGNRKTETLKIIAVSEGTEPLNTASLKITFGTSTSYFDAISTIDKDVKIILNKK